MYIQVSPSLALVVFLGGNLFTERNCASRQFHEEIELEIVKAFVGLRSMGRRAGRKERDDKIIVPTKIRHSGGGKVSLKMY